MAKQKTKPQNGQQFQKSKHEEIFMLAKDKQNKVRILVGNYVVSRKSFDTFEQAEKYIGTKPYELIINTACAVMQHNQSNENNIKETTKDA